MPFPLGHALLAAAVFLDEEGFAVAGALLFAAAAAAGAPRIPLLSSGLKVVRV
ncbi:MAG TPA: hypothetical protein VGX48_17825 [Pyrinomonadaceae bacterium]|nr:hypothetical protein [Pyrinomonadaceae bacterium]